MPSRRKAHQQVATFTPIKGLPNSASITGVRALNGKLVPTWKSFNAIEIQCSDQTQIALTTSGTQNISRL